MRTARFAVCAAALLLVQGCASILEGTDQTITVETSPTGANCRLYRKGKAVGQVITPGGVVVEKTKHDMTVECEKEGYETAKVHLDSGIEGAAFTLRRTRARWTLLKAGQIGRARRSPMSALGPSTTPIYVRFRGLSGHSVSAF